MCYMYKHNFHTLSKVFLCRILSTHWEEILVVEIVYFYPKHIYYTEVNLSLVCNFTSATGINCLLNSANAFTSVPSKRHVTANQGPYDIQEVISSFIRTMKKTHMQQVLCK